MESGEGRGDSSDEVGNGSEDELVFLQTVSRYVTRSLKRKRERSKFDKCKMKKITRDRKQGRPVVDKDVFVSKSRYNRNYLISIIKEFDGEQRQIIIDADFGALLDLDGGYVPWSFVKWLADHIDTNDEVMPFEDKTIPLCVDSFGHVLRIRTSGFDIPTETKTSTAQFLNMFSLSDMPSIKFFGERLKKKNLDKDEFLTCFMVVAFSCFYCPTSNTRPSTAYLAAFLQTDMIKSYNWGKFVQQWNMYYIKKYQQSSSTLAVCNYYLAVRYLDFVDFGNFEIQKALPRITVWKGEMIKDHIKLIMDEDHFYGKFPLKHISGTCYAAVCMTHPATHAMSIEQLKCSMEAFQNNKFSQQVTSSICSLFEHCTLNESESTCTKVQELVIKVVECLIENNCISSGSQSTENVKRSQGDENATSGSTVKLSSSQDGSSLHAKQGKANTHKDERDSQQSTCSVAANRRQSKVVLENNTTSETNQVKELSVDPRTKPLQSTEDKTVDERVMPLNTALYNLQIKEISEVPKSDCQNRETENQGNKEELESFSNRSASFQHMLDNEKSTRGLEEGTSKGITDILEANKFDSDPKTPTTTLDMFKVIETTGKGKSDSVIYVNSSSIQCAQKIDDSDKQIVKYVPPASYNSPDLSSGTKNQSYSTEEYAPNLEDMKIEEYEVVDNHPSIPIEVAFQNAPRNQQLRNYRLRQEQKAAESKRNADFKTASSPRSPIKSPERHIQYEYAEMGNNDSSPASTPKGKEKYTIILSSQESHEVQFVGERHGTPPSTPEDQYEEVYIGQHRLSPIRQTRTEIIHEMYNKRNVSSQFSIPNSTSVSSLKTPLPPRRMVQASKFVSSPYDVNVCSNEPTDQEYQHYQSIVRLASMENFMHQKAILIDNCKITMETFGKSLKVRGVVDAWVINVFSRILFREKHPKESNRHTFFHMSSEYFLEKWQNEGRRIYLRDQAIRAFEGAGKAKKLHLTELLHFPSLQNDHWFLFTVDIRDEKFFFMDSYFGKDSKLHKKADEKMIKNFIEIWEECCKKKVDFSKFDRVYPKVPQQNNNKDCGIYVMKNIQLFSPRTALMGVYSFEDIPNIRIHLANHMMFCQFNEMDNMKQAVVQFDPRVHGRYARQM